MQCVPVPNDNAGFNATSLAKDLPLTTALAAYLNTDTTCTRYIPSYGQCGGSAGSCYGTYCLVRAWRVCLLLHAWYCPIWRFWQAWCKVYREEPAQGEMSATNKSELYDSENVDSKTLQQLLCGSAW